MTRQMRSKPGRIFRRVHALRAAVLALLLLAGPALAEDGDLKIGMVDLEQALNATDEGKAAREEMARKRREAEQQLQPMIDQYNELKEEIKGKRYVLSDEALFGKNADLLELQNKIDNKMKELEGQLKIDQGRLEAPLVQKLKEIIEEIGKEDGFSLILSRGQPVLYSREALDITDAVIERFNKRS
jgi:outer membrane protein